MSIKMKALAILLSLVVLAGVAVASACSTRTPGYWKNHPEAWPTYSESYDGVTYNIPIDAMDILWTPPKGDARIILEQKVISAELSILADFRGGWNYPGHYEGGPFNGATLPQLVTMANDYLAAHTDPMKPGTDATVRSTALAYASAIDYWLNFFDEAPIV